MRLLITTITTALLISSAVGEEAQLRRVLAQDESSSHNTVMHAAVQDQITDSLGADSLASSNGGFDANNAFLAKRHMDKPSELVFSCVTGQNKTITAKFGMVIDSLTHACKAIGEPGRVRAKWPYPATIEADNYTEHGPYFVWKVGYRPPTQKRLALAANEKKSDAETPHIIATYNCDLLDVVTEDLVSGKYEYCTRKWVEI
ncbi:hypothetical protein BGHDH14_bgh04954 [Blumeria hordei DH14]|uniref:Secreted effector protein n=1 Tax=Blumeria graminis f. sp. hordei (strain DH14) TaxID=546991 RepID=N1J9K4_BLUG1|nr:hypothetical protein BGHDH14_bgh04954 [Blumeria hordei DH14]